MANFTDSELFLINKIESKVLKDCINDIKDQIEIIWSTDDAIRIIKGYTSHGAKHSERDIGYIKKIIEKQPDHFLNDSELFVLLASAYLHDIGMQCDVVRFPEILKKSEDFGATFDIEFSAKDVNSYSIKEQKEIRKNHSALTAAWIHVAFHQKITSLVNIFHRMPEEYIGDIIDVCKYHSKFPITSCPVDFHFHASYRKQLVAAILRFADELDIDSTRVTLETVKNFSLDSQNSIYWWIHNRTIIDFNYPVIQLKIRLARKDKDHYSDFFKKHFIDEFQSKNQSTTQILGISGLYIDYSINSKVVIDEYADPLPQDICNFIEESNRPPNHQMALVEEIVIWLRAIQFETSTPNFISPHCSEMVASINQGSFSQNILIHCIEGEINSQDVDRIKQKINLKTPRGWLISDSRISPLAIENAKSIDEIEIFNLSSF